MAPYTCAGHYYSGTAVVFRSAFATMLDDFIEILETVSVRSAFQNLQGVSKSWRWFHVHAPKSERVTVEGLIQVQCFRVRILQYVAARVQRKQKLKQHKQSLAKEI